MPEYILDTCVDIDPKHANYPAYFFKDLLSNTRVKLVIGGTKALEEAKAKTKLTELLNNLRDRNQVIVVCQEKVDDAEKQLNDRIQTIIGDVPPECDDLHIFALANVSGCLLVISRDNRMATCRNNIRNYVGHAYCPDISVIQNEASYKKTK
ncbi:hypothetical protein [Cognatishimia maritima]|uniref:PIN domain-containing protein n=1 Tax=Cognatishimia maritima TaxID=870908 RepID=A0A1M5L3B9_9RHOB|nr:hypothetical protein [Cognatishimia maritima]SHG59517.1 hypothetical protein SAMN04488044_1149 [Cognatishimia maritima]